MYSRKRRFRSRTAAAPAASAPLFTPAYSTNLSLWLDGADSSTFSFSSGSNVSQWRDKSGNGLNFSTTTGTPTYTSNTLTIPSGAIMTSSASISLTTNTYVYIVSQLTTVNSFNMLLAFSGINPSGNAGDFSIRFTTTGLGGTAANPGGVNDFANTQYYVNGISNPSDVTVSTYTARSVISGQSISSGTTGLTISSSFFSRFFIGNVHEVLIYPSVPTATQRQQIEGYLAWKWGIQTRLPTNHPYYASAPTVPSVFSPAVLTNLSAWFDAADASTVLFSSGSNVSQWNDKSGNNRNLTPNSGTTTYVSNSIRLNTSAMSVTNSVNLSSFSFFMAGLSPNNVSNQTLFVGRPSGNDAYNSTDGFSVYIDANLNRARYYGNYLVGSQTITNTSVVTTSPFLISFTGASSGALSSWQNGTAGGTASTGSRGTSGSGFGIGGEWGNGIYGNFISSAHYYEIIVFSARLTDSQRQQIEGYLAWKWGLQTSLPTNHPYYNSSP